MDHSYQPSAGIIHRLLIIKCLNIGFSEAVSLRALIGLIFESLFDQLGTRPHFISLVWRGAGPSPPTGGDARITGCHIDGAILNRGSGANISGRG